MGLLFWRKKEYVSVPPPQSASALAQEERLKVEEMIDEGYLPTEISQETGFPAIQIYAVQKALHKRRARIAAVKNPPPSEKQGLRAEIEELKLQAERDRIKNELEYESEKRALELQIKRLELEQKRAELEEEDEEEEDDLLGDDMNLGKFLIHLMQKGARPQATSQVPLDAFAGQYSDPITTAHAPQQPDVTKPLTRDQIQAEIARASPAEIAQIKAAPKSLVKKALKQKYAGITDENVKLILAELK